MARARLERRLRRPSGRAAWLTERRPSTAERLIVVSMRLPLTIRRSGGSWQAQASNGGLVAALGPMAERLDAHWIGWDGHPAESDDPGRRALLETWEREHGFVAVDLPASVVEGFYDRYSNATLWPLLHGFPARIELDQPSWEGYEAANRLFADAVVARARPRDLIWVHDYQLALVPGLVRERLPDAAIGFFLHVPFPGSDSFRVLPEREAFLRGLLGADLVAFQTHGHLHDFRRALLEVLALSSGMDRVSFGDRTVSLAAIPVGIVLETWERRLRRRDVRERIAQRRAAAEGVRTILAIDRLDDTKGIPERLRAFRELLRRWPRWRGRVQLLQVAVPSRERVPRYAELRRAVSELVGEINGEFATPEWTPVAYLRRSIDPGELTALYATADVAWVAPLRDGMNLVAKEFIACQAEAHGVLVLSEFAGAAQELAEAIRVNPFDARRSAEAIDRALTMPDAERATREAALLARVRRHDAAAWADRFLGGLRDAVRTRRTDRPVPLAPESAVLEAAATSPSRLLYLDYDGTLVPIASRPEEAVPTARLLDVLRGLAADRRTTVAILSGRGREDLDRWFGDFDRLWLVAEHGALLRDPSTGDWRPLHAGADTAWKDRIRPTLEDAADRAPGSFIEEKVHGLAWHYRLADPEFGQHVAGELLARLERELAGTDLVALAGRKVVEVRFAWANKAAAAFAIRAAGSPPDFELALGDDRTDEDLFDRLPATAWTIHVGRARSAARFAIPGPEEAVGLLAAVAALPAAAKRGSGREPVDGGPSPRPAGRARDRGAQDDRSVSAVGSSEDRG